MGEANRCRGDGFGERRVRLREPAQGIVGATGGRTADGGCLVLRQGFADDVGQGLAPALRQGVQRPLGLRAEPDGQPRVASITIRHFVISAQPA